MFFAIFVVSYNANPRFAILIGRSQRLRPTGSEGVSRYDILSGEEVLHIPFSEIGYRTLLHFRQSIFSKDTKLLLFKAEHSDDKDLNNWSVGTNQREWMLYDIEKKEIVWKHKGSEMHADFISLEENSVSVDILQHYRNPEGFNLEEWLTIHKVIK
ncbi:hypothetical protein [Hugenholtzia roseola]|uniref:hypothetical protein n=1 Tax=Hugenholtzia roseola TaxID=1002 RepID=UPI00047914AE|nr:hypothetical protein [Hugenholtzia roseola]